MFSLINNPVDPDPLETLVAGLEKFNGEVIIQSMFLRGTFKGEVVDNTTVVEVDAWLQNLLRIKPRLVMIYPIARDTPVHNLVKIPAEELNALAARVLSAGLNAKVYE